jgi:hypothetical protein
MIKKRRKKCIAVTAITADIILIIEAMIIFYGRCDVVEPGK